MAAGWPGAKAAKAAGLEVIESHSCQLVEQEPGSVELITPRLPQHKQSFTPCCVWDLLGL